MPRVLIAGCGYVGAATAEIFHAAGWEVEGWTHSAESAAALRERPFIVRQNDISQRAAIAGRRETFDLVIHCASSGGGGAESYRRIYYDGARHLLEELRPPRFIFTSSTSVYAQTDGSWVDEASPAEPKRETGQILRETEEFVRQKHGTIARLAGIYGPGRSALLRKILSGEARIDGDGDRILNQVHRDDIAAALLFLAQLPNEKVAGEIYNVVDDEPIAQRAACEWLAEKTGRPSPPIAAGNSPRKRGDSNKRVSNRKLRALGWVPQFPTFQEGMENCLRAAEL